MEDVEAFMADINTATYRNLPTRQKAKTSQRLKYEAEMAVLKRDLGTLEEIRIRLGLSRRKICQILLVDPSAWTRWTAEGSDAPPHIYQALHWYLDSKKHQNRQAETYWNELKGENRGLHSQLAAIKLQISWIKRLSWIAILAALSVIGIAVFYRV